MTSTKTEAESLARGIELGIIPVSDAVAWADSQIEESDIPHNSICEISMSSSKYPQDVVHLLRSLPGEIDAADAVQLTVRHLLVALRDLKYDSESIAHALYDLAMADDLPDGRMKQKSSWYWDEIGLSRAGYKNTTVGEIRADMIAVMTDFIGCESDG